MRWFWIDRFLSLQSGHSAETIKTVTAAEPAVEEYMPGYPVYPPSLMIEGIAQTGGLLVGEMGEFRHRVVLAKIGRAEFLRPVMPGSSLYYRTTIVDVNQDGAAIHAEISVRFDGQQHDVGRAEMMFAYLKDGVAGLPEQMFPPVDLMVMLRLFGLFEVARDENGQPRPIPAWLVQSEREELQPYITEAEASLWETPL